MAFRCKTQAARSHPIREPVTNISQRQPGMSDDLCGMKEKPSIGLVVGYPMADWVLHIPVTVDCSMYVLY